MSIHQGAEHQGNLTLDTDVVVVGSGAGGAVAACILAEAGQRVLVLEEGHHVAPEAYGALSVSEQMRSMWRDCGLLFALPRGDTPVINVMIGKGVGGSSVLTGGVCFRTPDWVLQTWQDTRGLPMMTSKALEPCFEDVERAIHVEEVPVSNRSRSTTLFAEGARKLGYELKPMRRNTQDCEGLSRCNFGCPKGHKLAVDITYLPRALAKGTELWSDCLVEKVLVEDGRAVGVKGRVLNGRDGRAGGKLVVKARRVVVAAGAVHSALLLMRSGIGRRSEQVGKNMTLHPGFRVMARFDEPVTGWQGALQSAYSDAFEHDRYTLVSLFVPPGALAATMPGVGAAHVERARQIPNLAIFGGLIHDEGSGAVHRLPGREPAISYEMSRVDRAVVPKLVRKMAETWFAAGAKEIFLPILGFEGITADQLPSVDLEHIPMMRMESASQHPLGTCRMGGSPDNSVIDSSGETWDVKELFLADGSIIPTSLGVNPQLTIMAMATWVGWKMRERPLPT